MEAWKKLIRKEIGNKKYPTLGRIKVGRAINVIAALPLCTSWMAVIGIPMTMAISPTSWAKGRLNERKGNGALKW